MAVYFTLLALVCLERVAELAVSQRNAARSLQRGGRESGQGHFPPMVALHAALLAGCWIEPIALHRTFLPGLGWPMIVLVIAANALRWWCIASLGPRWSARVIVTPGLPLVRLDVTTNIGRVHLRHPGNHDRPRRWPGSRRHR